MRLVPSFARLRLPVAVVAVAVTAVAVVHKVQRTIADGKAVAGPAVPPAAGKAQAELYNHFLARHPDMTYDQLHAHLGVAPAEVQSLSFEPTTAKHFDLIAKKLELTPAERDIYKANGFVSVDLNRRYSFASAYHQAFTLDLPVLVTTDSVLHAMHRSFDDILMGLESNLFAPALERVLADAHDALAAKYPNAAAAPDSARDVDLYLTVARRLFADKPEPSRFGQDAAAAKALELVASLKLQTPDSTGPTLVYGGERYVDYSQFKPRGHYTKSPGLERYFRGMMWLGRADCGWNVLPTDDTPGLKVDSDRELRDAVLFVELLRETGGLARLKQVDDVIAFLVGASDNLSPADLDALLTARGVRGLADVRAADLDRLKAALKEGGFGRQAIQSQYVQSPPGSGRADPPALFQVFGQRFVIDSFVLSKVTFDSIKFEGLKQRRFMPTGLDVAAALGNTAAVPLLEPELRKWNYSANLAAAREFADAHGPGFWDGTLYNVWLGALRTLHAPPPAGKHFPEAMRTEAWRRKTLQTQLASWAELRHDTVLYAKESYADGLSCEYPAGYVEPYPAFYAAVRKFAEEAGRRLGALDVAGLGVDPNHKQDYRGARAVHAKETQVRFFAHMAAAMGTLETMARKELDGEPFTADETKFVKSVVVPAGKGCVAGYGGWYTKLYYDGAKAEEWDAVVVGVHTDVNPDPETGRPMTLHVGVGDATFGVLAADNAGDRMAFVGPVYTYYEFRHPAGDRLTDEQWQKTLEEGKAPPRPAWVDAFQAPQRPPGPPVTLRR